MTSTPATDTKAADPLALERVVLDVELLAHAKTGCSQCHGAGWLKVLTVPSGAQLARNADGETRDGVSMRVPDGVAQPRLQGFICTCAAKRFARANAGRFLPLSERFHWLAGKAPPLPSNTRSPLAERQR